MRVAPSVTPYEVGGGIVVAVFMVDRIIGWIVKLKGKTENGKDQGKSPLTSSEFCKEMNSVGKVHDKMTVAIDSQTIVLDRIYQGQTLQLKALDKIVDRLDDYKPE
jgi:hypothetical protein